MSNPQQHKILMAIAILLLVNVSIEIYKIMVPPAHAASTIDCRIVDISNSIYGKIPVKIAEIDSSLSSYSTIPIEVREWESSDEVKVKVVDWDTSDEVKVKVSN